MGLMRQIMMARTAHEAHMRFVGAQNEFEDVWEAEQVRLSLSACIMWGLL